MTKFRVESCDRCGKAHILTVEYGALFFPDVWPPPDPETVTLDYVCPRTREATTADVQFPSPVNGPRVVKVENQ